MELDRGEAEAIALAIERKADTILMDEREGREAARRLGLNPVGALGVLLKAKANGHVESLRIEMERLRSEAGFFIAEELRTALLDAAGES